MNELLNDEVVNVADEAVETLEAIPNNSFLKYGVGALVVTGVIAGGIYLYKKVKKGKTKNVQEIVVPVTDESQENSEENSEA